MELNSPVLEKGRLETLEVLRTAVAGAVVVNTDPEYTAAKSSWNLIVEHEPSVIVVAENLSDIQAAVRYAATQGLPVAVQATGHGQFRACEGGLLLNLSQMNGVSIDADKRTARVSGGAQWKDVLVPAQEIGLSALSGSAPHVGVVGYLLGGGYGLMLRKFGLGVDSIRSFTVVTAEGEVVRASASESADLYWALLGGGGAFGVVAEIEIELFPVSHIYGGSVMYPVELAPALYPAYASWSKGLADEVTSCISLMTFPPVPFVPEFLHGKSVVIVTASVCADEATAIELLRPMREFGTPITDSFTMMPYAQSGAVFQDPVDPLPAKGQGLLLKGLDESAVATLLAAIGDMQVSPNLKIDLRHLGGAASRVPAEKTPIGTRRDAEYLLYLLGVPMGPVSVPMIVEHAEAVIEAMQPWAVCRGPLNWIGEADVKSETIRQVYTQADLERLRQIKRQYDPANLFRFASLGIDLAG